MSHVRPTIAVSALLAALAFTPSAHAAVLPAPGGIASPGADTPIVGLDGTNYAAPAGDVNGDGRADVLDTYESRILFGAASRATVDLATANDRLWKFGASPWTDVNGAPLPAKLRPVGDLNGDGRDDVFAHRDLLGRDGAPLAPGQAAAVIAPGPTGPRTTDLGAPSQLLARIVDSARAGLEINDSPTPIGDVDGDGKDDLLLTWRYSDGAPQRRRGLSVIYGGAGAGAGGVIDLANPAHVGFQVYANEPASVPPGGGDPFDYATLATPTAVGDVNGDGLADFAVARRITTGKSYAWFVYGSRDRTRGDLDLDNRAGRAARVGPIGFSSTIERLGDWNRDGRDEVGIHTTEDSTTILPGRATTTDMGISTTFGKINWRLRVAGPPIDVNGDGVPDAVGDAFDFVNYRPTLAVAVFGRSDLKSISVPGYGSASTAAIRFPYGAMALGDVDGDGNGDLLSSNGIVYGYGAGTQPTPDSTGPVLGWTLTSNYAVGTCWFGQKRKISGESSLSLDEGAKVELVAVQSGVTRRATVERGPGQSQYFALPTSLIGTSLGSVVITATPTDAAGNRGASQSLTVPIKAGGYTFFC